MTVTKEQASALAAKYGGKADDYLGYEVGDVRGDVRKFSQAGRMSLSLPLPPAPSPLAVRAAELEKENADLRAQLGAKAEKAKPKD